MKKISVPHIRRWLVLLLVLVILTTLGAYLLTYFEINRTLMELQSFQAESDAVGGLETHLPGLRMRLLLVMSGGLLVICGVGIIWISLATRHLSQPLRTISTGISKIARGRLNETVKIDTDDEFAQIANGINELAANLQELLLYIWKQSGQCLEQLQQLEVDTTKAAPYIMTPADLAHLKQLHRAVIDLREMAKAYVFYDVHLEGEKTLSLSKSGLAQAAEKDCAAGSEL